MTDHPHSTTGLSSLKSQLHECAGELGFVLCGIASAIASPGYPQLVDWITRGYAGEMSYFRQRLAAYQHPTGVLAGAKSIIVLAYPYDQGPDEQIENGSGRIARYAWSGDDYHDLIHPKLKQLCRLVSQRIKGANSRGIVDTAPLMEREFAQLAGLGWRGKNTLLLNKRLGSYFFLACVLVDIQLPAEQPHQTDHCGSCRACLDACPTAAFPAAGLLDATRCISYLTIEHRGPIDVELRSGIGDWVFGCDVCQQVCPWNRKPARRAVGSEDQRPLETLELTSLFAISDDEFRRRFRKTPLWRTRRRGVLRNAAIVLGNQGTAEAVPVLTRGLNDVEPIVRGASAWALGQVTGDESLEALRARLRVERDKSVIDEIRAAILLAASS